MSRTFLVTGNGGQGKTTIASNLAIALRSLGYDVLLVDANMVTPKLCYHCQIFPQLTIQDVLLNRCTAREALYQGPSGLKILFSNLGPRKTPHASTLLPELQRLADIVIIDVPSRDFAWYQTGLPTILVSQPDFPSIMEAYKIKAHIPTLHGLIINRAHYDENELSAYNIQKLAHFTILGIVPEESAMREALKHGFPLMESHPDANASIILKQIASHLVDQEYETFSAHWLQKIGIRE